MLRLAKLGIALICVCFAFPAHAQRIFGWCEQGGHRVVTNGLQSSNKVQQSFPACTITVFNGGTVVPATIFSDAGLTTPLANPFTATSTGFWAFFSAPSTYDVQFSGTGITTPFTVAGYTNSSGGGGGGGSVGPGTVNNLSKFTSTTNVGNTTCTDDGVTPMACGLGVSLSTSALFTVKQNNGSTGTTVNLLIARDSSGQAINAQPTDINNVIGVAGFGAGTTGSVSIAYSGQFPCTFDNQTAIGDWVTLGSNSRCHDAGATEPAGVENMGRINSINAGAGTLAGVDWGLPDSTNTSAGGGTGVVNNCSNASALAYYATTGNTVSCPAGATVDGSGNISAPSFTGAGANAGFIVSQQGTVPTLSVANSNYLYGDSTITTTFGTALPSAPGTLNQVMAITSVPDATHIKLGYISTPGVSSGTPGNPAIYVGATSLASSNQTLDASAFAGTHWTDKVVAAYTALGAPGGTIIIPDSIADNGSATTPTIPSNVTLLFTGSATFTSCTINLGKFTKIFNNDALLQLSGSSCIGLNMTTQATLQQTDTMILSGVRIDCALQASSTGIILGASTAQVSLRDIRVANCKNASNGVGIYAKGVQFAEIYNVETWNNDVGAKWYSIITTGGGNSLNLYGRKSVGDTVGDIIINQSAAFPQTSIYYIDPTFISDTICGMAVFGDTSVSQTDVHWYGAAPESNASGAATVVIDGKTVKRSAIYANQAAVYLQDVYVSDATANPEFLAETNSTIHATNLRGYGCGTCVLIQADSTSTSTLEGTVELIGTVQNAVGYPVNLSNQETAQFFGMYGAPLLVYNPTVPNSWTAGNPQTPAFADITGASSQATATDAVYGLVNTVTFAASGGSKNTNRARIGNLITSATGVTSDIFVSLLMKCSADASVAVGDFNLSGQSGFVLVNCKAGQWTRVITYETGIAAGTGNTYMLFANDSTGATVSVTGVEALAFPSGSVSQQQGMSTVLTTGAVNPNLGNCSAVGTAASPSVASCGNAAQGNFSCATAATGATCTVNTTRVTANSQIFVQEDETQGTKLGVTCNTGTTVIPTSRLLASKVASTSFTINLGTVTTNPGCFSYQIIN